MEVHNSSALVLAVIYLLILQQDSAPILWAFPKMYPIVSQNILTLQKKKEKKYMGLKTSLRRAFIFLSPVPVHSKYLPY